MLKKHDALNVSLADIYNLLVHMSAEIGECKASAEHNEDVINRVHLDLKEKIDEMKTIIYKLERIELIRESRKKLVWKILRFMRLVPAG